MPTGRPSRGWKGCSVVIGKFLARKSHRFLLNGYNLLDNKELWDSARNSLFLRWCSAETSKREAREAALSLRSAWSRAPARSRRGSRSVLPRIASRICETSGLRGFLPAARRDASPPGTYPGSILEGAVTSAPPLSFPDPDRPPCAAPQWPSHLGIVIYRSPH